MSTKSKRNSKKKRPFSNRIEDTTSTKVQPNKKQKHDLVNVHELSTSVLTHSLTTPRRVGLGSGRLPPSSNPPQTDGSVIQVNSSNYTDIPVDSNKPDSQTDRSVLSAIPLRKAEPKLSNADQSSDSSSSDSDDESSSDQSTGSSASESFVVEGGSGPDCKDDVKHPPILAVNKSSAFHNMYSILDPDVQTPASEDDGNCSLTSPEIQPTSSSISSTNIILKRPFSTQPRFEFNLGDICKPVSIHDVQNLILWLLSYEQSVNPKFLLVHNRPHISKLVVLDVPRLNPHRIVSSLTPTCPPKCPIEMPPKRRSQHHVQHNPSALGHLISPKHTDIVQECESLATIFHYILPLKGSGPRTRVTTPVKELFNVPMTRDEKKALRGQNEYSSLSDSSYSLAPLLMTTEKMESLQIPIHPLLQSNSVLPTGWTCLDMPLNTPKPTDNDRVLLALDCEMCLAQGSESILTRIAIVNEKGESVYDTLVTPHKPIVDYLTRFSGVTADMLQNVTTTLADVQNTLLSMLTPNTILIAHSIHTKMNFLFDNWLLENTLAIYDNSIENDLKAIKLTHPFLLDTSQCYSATPSQSIHRRPALRVLAENYLNRTIQSKDSNAVFGNHGHSPVEDALTCIDLIKLKIMHGPEFGLRDPVRNLIDILKQADSSKVSAFCDHVRSCNQYGSTANHVFVTNSDHETVTSVKHSITNTKASFIWGRLVDLDQLLKHTLKTEDVSEPSIEPTPEAVRESLGSTTKRIVSIWNALPAGGVLIVFSGYGEPNLMQAMDAENRAAIDAPTKPMDLPDFRAKFWHAVSLAKAGCCMFAVKP